MMHVSKDGSRVELNLTLTREEWDAVVLMAGMATGAATLNGMRKLAYRFLAIANKLNEGNPDWKPYEIPPEAN